VGLIQLRRQLQRRPDDQHPPTYDPDLFRARFALLRRVDNLDGHQAAQLQALFDAYPLFTPTATTTATLTIRPPSRTFWVWASIHT